MFNKFVVSTGAKRSGEICGIFPIPKRLKPMFNKLSSRPERSAVERSAVLFRFPKRLKPMFNKLSSRPERSAVERSAVFFLSPRD